MKKTRFTETQTLKILKEAEAGVPVADLCREHGFGKSTFYKWKAKYGGMDASALRRLADAWGEKYAIAVRSWENNWDDLATMFDYTPEIRRLIYTTNLIEAYHRQLRKVTKNRAAFPSPEAARKLLWLAHRDIARKWTMPIPNWAIILNQLAIRFEDRFPI